MSTCNVSQLLSDGKCFQCLDEKGLRIVTLQLLCEVQAKLALGLYWETLTYDANMVIDLEGAPYQYLALTGDADFDFTNVPTSDTTRVRAVAVILKAVGGDRNLTFSSGTFVGATPAVLASGKTAVLSCTGLIGSVILAYQVQP